MNKNHYFWHTLYQFSCGQKKKKTDHSSHSWTRFLSQNLGYGDILSQIWTIFFLFLSQDSFFFSFLSFFLNSGSVLISSSKQYLFYNLCFLEFKFRGFTILYFKMAVMPLVPETKIADVGKLISLGNLLVRKVTWLVLTTMSATLILSHDFGADCMTRIAYIYSRLSRTHFPISTHRNNTLSYTATYRDNSFFPFWLPETTHTLSLTFDFQQSTSRNVNSLQLFSSLF